MKDRGMSLAATSFSFFFFGGWVVLHLDCKDAATFMHITKNKEIGRRDLGYL